MSGHQADEPVEHSAVEHGAVWLDHAATSWPKPASVLASMQRWFLELGVDASRGTTPRHSTVRREVSACRRVLADLTASSPERVIFCSGATEALNAIIQAWVQPDDLVWSTPLEHNAVARTLHARGARVVALTRNREGATDTDPYGIFAALDAGPPPKLLVYNHVSNVTGAITDLSYAAHALRAHGCRIAVDCAQSAGRLDLRPLDADALAIPGHKGLQGPPGIGVLALRGEAELRPARFGGTGSSTATLAMPTELPGSLEAGTPNTPAILGLAAGIAWVLERGLETIHAHEVSCTQRLRSGLTKLEEQGRVRLFGGLESGVLSMDFADFDVHEVAGALADDGIFTRAGYHCTSQIHDWIDAPGGTLRLSPGPETCELDLERCLDCLRDLLA